MAKTFESRVSKKKRDFLDITAGLDQSLLDFHDQKLLQGARLDDISLEKIEVRKQVRTTFNDESIKELAENIRVNGLIQPLVIHREGDKYVLICGERRFRAMSLIDEMKKAPCFILENKSDEELMAIQFSENSAREQLHYIDQADSIAGYKKLTGASERKIQAALGISKSEVHRCLKIAKLHKKLKNAAKLYNIEKYVLLEFLLLPKSKEKDEISHLISEGKILKRIHLRKVMNDFGFKRLKADSKEEKKASIAKKNIKKDDDLIQMMTSMNLTDEQKKKLKKLLH